MSMPIADSSFNPIAWAAYKLPNTKRMNFTDPKVHKKYTEQAQETATSMQMAYRPTPTPASTGAPVPGYRKRGSYITPSNTGAPMPGTLKNKATTTTPAQSFGMSSSSSTKVPVKPRGAKPTALGTQPKKK